MNTSVTQNQLIAEFASLIQQGIDAWERAGQLLVSMIDADSSVRTRIIDRCPHLSEAILTRFEAIGRRTLHPKTLLNNSPGMVRLRDLPYEQQAEYLVLPLNVLVPRMDGKRQIEKISIGALSKEQVMQVIGNGGVRSIAEQEDYLKRRGGKGGRAIRDGNENRAAELRRAYESLAEPEKVATSAGDCEGMLQKLQCALDALVDARSALETLKAESKYEAYLTGCIRGIGIVRMAIRDGHIKANIQSLATEPAPRDFDKH